MDLSIRRNESCIIGLPRCDYVFNSNRSCFIGYGYLESNLEREIISTILLEKNIDPIDAGTLKKPAQNVFCTKICSKILTSQFCIILANNDTKKSKEIPNANVNMEYGLMLGFNKYVIPFQKENQKLPFNTSGLDTIKYTSDNFKSLAEKHIDEAIQITTNLVSPKGLTDVVVDTFIASRDAYMSGLDDVGEKSIYRMGSPFGFWLLNKFDGLNYVYFGQFTKERPEIICWRIKLLIKMLEGRMKSFPNRVEYGIVKQEQLPTLEKLFKQIEIWLLVQTDEDREIINKFMKKENINRTTQIFTAHEIKKELEEITTKIHDS